MVWVSHYRVVSGLPNCIIGDAPVEMPVIVLVDSVAVHRTKLAVGIGVLIRVRFHRVRGWGLVSGFLVCFLGFLSRACSAKWGVIGSSLPILVWSFLLNANCPSFEDK